MSPEVLGGILGLAGGLLSGAIAAFSTIFVYRSQNSGLEKDEIRRRKVEVIFMLLGSRYVLIESYNASSAEVQTFNTAMALFSVYFPEIDVRKKYDKFITNKSDENLIEMLKTAGKITGLDLLDSAVSKTMYVNPRIIPLEIVTQYLGAAKSEKK